MKNIPIENIYYLLCYAWDNLEEKDLVKVDPIGDTRLADLFAKVLINGIYYLRRRGLDRGYLDFAEETGHLRGKINFNQTIKRNLLTCAKAHCEFDNLDHSILHNQILKATILRLLKVKDLDGHLKYDLIDLLRWFCEIDTITLTSSVFRRIQLNRNNAFYRFLMNVCELIFENLLVTEITGETQFRDFMRDDRAMERLFEKFILSFYKKEQDDFHVSASKIKWYCRILDEKSRAFLPEMRTDVTLSSRENMIIIDAKYYSQPLVFNEMKEQIRSTHLYQIYAYVKNAEHIDDSGKCCTGIMLYPTVDHDFDFKYEMEGHLIRFCSINLNQAWRGIHKDLLQLIESN
jgi:5-methylcytosine-specific restriction enzyme subunit McrC